MFNLFKKKQPGVKIIDRVLVSDAAKYQSMLTLRERDPDIVFVFWFDESLEQAASFFNAVPDGPVLLTAREAATAQLAGRTPVFAEHHPLSTKELELFQKLNLETVIVYSSLSEPLFRLFGADRIIRLIQQLGMKENEVIEHAMITRSIRNAQEKIARKVLVELPARSQALWLEKNNTT